MMCACLEGPQKDLDFAGLDLRRAIFRKNGAFAMDIDLSGADMSGANFSGTDVLRGARLSHADLRGADLEGADLLGVTGLATARLRGATFDGRTTLPISRLRPEEIGTRTQFRRVGCDLGMSWVDHDPETGLPENCRGTIGPARFFEEDAAPEKDGARISAKINDAKALRENTRAARYRTPWVTSGQADSVHP